MNTHTVALMPQRTPAGNHRRAHPFLRWVRSAPSPARVAGAAPWNPQHTCDNTICLCGLVSLRLKDMPPSCRPGMPRARERKREREVCIGPPPQCCLCSLAAACVLHRPLWLVHCVEHHQHQQLHSTQAPGVGPVQRAASEMGLLDLLLAGR